MDMRKRTIKIKRPPKKVKQVNKIHNNDKWMKYLEKYKRRPINKNKPYRLIVKEAAKQYRSQKK